MKKLKKIKILSHEYKIEYDDKLAGNSGTSAVVSTIESVITLSSIHSDSRQRECLIHEVIEGLNYHLEMKLSHGNITRLAEGLAQVMSDNKLWNI